MNKIMAGILAVILIAGCVNQQGPSSDSEITVHDNVQVEVIQGDFVLDDLYIEILDEQLNESMDQSDYDQMQDMMASDLSEFYYE
jgi:hypothetical protein